MENIDFEKLIRDLSKYTNRNLTMEDRINLKLIKEENKVIYPTRAAVLLADKHNYFEFARIKCARFKRLDVGEFIDQKEFGNSLFEQLENVMNFEKIISPRVAR